MYMHSPKIAVKKYFYFSPELTSAMIKLVSKGTEFPSLMALREAGPAL
jgi:hypothetical protein